MRISAAGPIRWPESSRVLTSNPQNDLPHTMNKLLIPLLLVVHYTILLDQRILELGGYHFVPAMACFAISTVVYGASLFKWHKAKLAITCWYLVVAYNLLSYLEMTLSGSWFLLASAGVAALILCIIHTLYQKQALPLPRTRLQQVCLGLWLLSLGMTAYTAFAWSLISLDHSLQYALPGFLAFLLTPAMRAPRLWLTPIQLLLLFHLAACQGIPSLTELEFTEIMRIIALGFIVSGFIALGWAYVRFLVQRRFEKRQTMHPATPSEEPQA